MSPCSTEVPSLKRRRTTPAQAIARDSLPERAAKSGHSACVVCAACGRNPELDTGQLLKCYDKQLRRKITIHACCALRAPPPPDVAPQQWWTEREAAMAWPTCPHSQRCSTDAAFVPFFVGREEWLQAFVWYNFTSLEAAARRFEDGRTPPYARGNPGPVLWRCDDRGSLGFARMAPLLADHALDEGLSRTELLLWGATVYRTFNRLSTFSRWAALRSLVASKGKGWPWQSEYEEEVYAARTDAFAIAASGVTEFGRNGVRDKWAWVHGRPAPPPEPCTARLPLPSEMRDFGAFISAEAAAGRGVMTGEHQVQSRERVLCMLRQLATAKAAGLRRLSAAIAGAGSASEALGVDGLQRLDTVGPFVAWQIWSDLVMVGEVEPTALPLWLAAETREKFALFGPGARKGALLMDGCAEARAVLDKDTDAKQGETLARARRIVADWPQALSRMGLADAWDGLARGRTYDLETAEHLLCGFYGLVPDLMRRCSKAVQGDAPAGGGGGGGAHSLSTSKRAAQWAPNPATNLEWADWQKMRGGPTTR